MNNLELEYSEEEVIDKAKQSLEKPDDFAYWGDSDMFKTWGFAGIDYSRGDDTINESNFSTFHDVVFSLRDQYELEFDDLDFSTESFNHWAVGSVDRYIVKVLSDDSGGVVSFNNITDAFKAVLMIHSMLEDYPILDDNDYEERSHQYIVDFLFDECPSMIDMGREDSIYKMIDSMNDCGIEICLDEDLYPSVDDLITAAHFSGLINEEFKENWIDWCLDNDLPIPDLLTVRKEIDGQIGLFEEDNNGN